MDAAVLEEVSRDVESDANWRKRSEVERMERWREVASDMPYIRFPRDWEVAIIPPFSGAVARFWVRKGAGHVSVYADFYERLGCWAEPHWEIYPDAEGDNARFSIATDTDAMLAAIAKSLAKQIRDDKRDTDRNAKR